MDELCSACLSSGRDPFSVEKIDSYGVYIQILSEIPVYDMPVSVRICWECRAIMRRFQLFKRQVKECYEKLIQFQNNSKDMKILQTQSHLAVICIENIDYPEPKVKIECEDILNSDTPTFVDQHVDIELDKLKTEEGEDTHCEPQTFVNNLHIKKAKVKKKNSVNKVKRKLKTLKTKQKKQINVKNLTKTHLERKKEERKSFISAVKSPINESIIMNNIDNSDYDMVLEDNSVIDDTELPIDKEEYRCNDCDKTFLVKMDLVNHIQVEHSMKMEPVKPLEGRRKRAPRATKEEMDEKPQCIKCGKMFSSRKTYRYHLSVLHEGQNRYPCPRCGKVYQWKSNLGRHMRSHKARDSGELYCSLCDKRFASIATYRQHLRVSRSHVTENEFTFMCNECGKKFVNKTRLRDHIDWEHLKKIKFRCKECNKPFKCNTSLYVHMQNVHDSSKRNKENLCHVCGKSYQNVAKLKYHIIAMHTSETPYQCSQCNAAFGWYSSLYRHIREVHYKMKLQVKKTKKSKRLHHDGLPLLFPPNLQVSLHQETGPP